MLENEIVNFSEKGNIIMIGDLNSRCSDRDDFIRGDQVNEEMLHSLNGLLDYQSDVNMADRQCPDKVVNQYGIKLLQLCTECNLRILNGRFPNTAKYTYYGPNGSSIVDYVIANPDFQ